MLHHFVEIAQVMFGHEVGSLLIENSSGQEVVEIVGDVVLHGQECNGGDDGSESNEVVMWEVRLVEDLSPGRHVLLVEAFHNLVNDLRASFIPLGVLEVSDTH